MDSTSSILARAVLLGAVLALAACAAPDMSEPPPEGLGMFVGSVGSIDDEFFIAVAAAEHPADEFDTAYLVYLCDNADRSTWLLLESDGGPLVFEGDDVTVTLSDVGVQRLANGSDAFTGEVAIDGEAARSFTAERAEEDAGLFRKQRVGPPDYIGGWIILNSTQQVGALTEGGTVIENPTLNLAARTAETSIGTLSDITQLPCIPVPGWGCIPLPHPWHQR